MTDVIDGLKRLQRSAARIPKQPRGSQPPQRSSPQGEVATGTKGMDAMYRRVGICTVLVAPAFAQTDRGTITGTVTDATKAVVPGAQVTITHLATQTVSKTRTTASGDYSVPSLQVGTYQVKIENEGFKAHVSNNVVLNAGGTARVDAVLEIGATTQTVEVVANAQLLQSDTARIATQVASKMVDELPLVVSGTVRSPFDLAIITPDVSGDGVNFRIGGGKINTWGITLDGVTATTGRHAGMMNFVRINAPSVEAITEFAVESGGFKAEYGHASGGSMSFVSKSGTNEYHGTAYEFLRNNALDSRGFFEAQKRIYKQNDFGVTFGGPVWIPKLYKGRDRTFFFFSYEGFRNRVGATATPFSVAPPEFYTGDFSNWVDQKGTRIQIYDPATTQMVNGKNVRTPFANNQIPQARFDSFSKAVMQYGKIAQPNIPGLVPGTSGYVRNNFLSYGVELTPFDKTSFKIDHIVTPRQRLSFYFGRTESSFIPGPSGTPQLPSYLSGYNMGLRNADVYRVNWDYTFTPTLINRFYAGGNNMRDDHWSVAQSMGDWTGKVCMKNVFDCSNFPLVTFSDLSGWGGDAHNGSDNVVVSFNDDITRVSGAHTLKAGYAYVNTHYNGIGEQNVSGRVGFNALSTSVPGDTNLATGGGSAFAAFLLGQAYSGAVDTPRFIPLQYRYHAMYVQDDWRVNSRLTFNLGMRYDLELPPQNGRDEFSNLDPTLPNPAAGGVPGAMIFAGFGPGRQNKRTLVPGWYAGFGPRLGFSYAVDKKTVLRASFARSFGENKAAQGTNHSQGFIQRWTIDNTSQGVTPTFIYADGLPSWTRPPFIDPSVANGSAAEWFQGVEASRLPEELGYVLNIERQLSGNMVVEAGYHGSIGSHVQSNGLNYNQVNYVNLPANLNPFTATGRSLLTANIASAAAVAAGIQKPYSSFTGTVNQSLRPFPQYSGIDAEARGGHSSYHSLQVKLDKRYSLGLTFQASYVFSKLLTDADGGSSGTNPLNNFNRRLEKSIAAYDQTHTVKLNYVYELPPLDLAGGS